MNDFSVQSGLQIFFPYEVASKTTAPAVKGDYSTHDALMEILAGSGLEIASESGKTITLRAAKAEGARSAAEPPPTEVVVTGSHIRGGTPTSPVHTLTQKDIDQSGYSQVGDLMRSLPENFSGGQNPGVMAASSANVGNQNVTNASTVNLRGLGSDATLVLVNGHRLSADSYFQGADISGVPLGALQRVEVVPDGASALYGSDAVAGVVNFILRKNYDGAEVSARTGAATDGGGEEATYSVLTGVSRSDWHALLNLEYSKQDGVSAGQRDFTADAAPATTLIRPQTRQSLFLDAGRDFGDRASVSFDALVGDRTSDSVSQSSPSDEPYLGTMYTPSYNVAIGADFRLPAQWKLKVTAVAAGSRNNSITHWDAYTWSGAYKNSLKSFDMAADGAIAHLPGGDLKLAVGLGYRQEHFEDVGSITADRDVRYAYAEVFAPLVAASDTRTGLHELEVDVSARSEDYSDFGKSTNPRLGVRYVPVRDVTVRATWGHSFKAPSFVQMYQASNLYLYPASALGYSGSVSGATALMSYGGNKDLKPETSTSMTLGADYNPLAMRSLNVSFTWFDIEYKNRVVQPVANLVAALSNAIYAPFIEADPTPTRLDQLSAAADGFYNFSGAAYDQAKVVAVVYDNYQNASAQTVKGLDLSYRQTFNLTHGSLNGFANATWLSLKQQTLSTLPTQELSGTLFNAPDFKQGAV